ncbi:type IV conjugative transfer system protein TraL [Brevundimonas nasdae]|uniref:type IV conjugative transfer system protein TraL n=1 Tax=Brevundimonas nasdae TaxID=172043 RepID=UPI003F68FDE4
MKDSYIPQHLDAPERYLVFTADELMAVVGPLLVCILVSNFAVGLVVAAACLWSLRKFKQGSSLSRIKWAAYWLLPADVFRLKATPPSHLRELAG